MKAPPPPPPRFPACLVVVGKALPLDQVPLGVDTQPRVAGDAPGLNVAVGVAAAIPTSNNARERDARTDTRTTRTTRTTRERRRRREKVKHATDTDEKRYNKYSMNEHKRGRYTYNEHRRFDGGDGGGKDGRGRSRVVGYVQR